ncbi:uncharacterized protein LOC142342229 isoform X2 [Convolutriloba macropyga]|uniref:uncharacterized protein LOC142342229 isoform X2 n=1 Tax=Convolutriloba macropyga TaxID=536237 RepID=UPI003F51C9FC
MDRRSDFGGRRNDVYSRESPRSGSGGYGGDRDRGERRPSRRDDPDEQRRKMFCGGLSVDTSKSTVETYFNRFGPLQEVIMVTDSRSLKPRGFCFIIFQDESSLDLVLSERTHTIDGRNVECTRAVGREEVRNNPGSIRKTKRVYLARTKDLSEEEIADYFENYIGKDLGNVEAVELMKNKETGVHRGFGFVNFSTFEAADKVCSQKDHKIGRQDVVAIKAEPKADRPGDRYPPMGGGGRMSDYGPDRRAAMMPPAPSGARMIAPALQASLAGRPAVTPSGQTAADLRRLEEEIMIREEQLKIKEMKLQLHSARLAESGGAGGMTRGGSMMSGGAPVSAGGAYSDRMMGPPTVHSSGQYVSGGGGVDEYIDRRSAASSAALSSGTGGPIRTRDNRYVMMQAIKDEVVELDQGYSSMGAYSSGGSSAGMIPQDNVAYYGGGQGGGAGYY